ncbi:MAG: T9SS type A sorting domain-containing protein [Ignavibacterium sp.]|nr:T9SS type A sorting domain-containing protein [Ignavibacterium sp.]
MKTLLETILIFSLLAVTNLPQQQNFLPLRIGNEYQTYNGTNYFFAEIERDTVYPNGKTYYTLPGPIFEFDDTRVDEFGNIYTTVVPLTGITGTLDEYMIFKADAQDGEMWPVAWGLPVIDTLYAKLLFTDTLFVFGQNKIIKAVLLYENGVIQFAYWLADGIGQIQKAYSDGTVVFLNYAKINGTVYGNLVGIDDDEIIKPLTYNVSQNYPNPFNSSTSISYSIAEAGFVSLKVFDILGQEVSALVNEDKEAGMYDVVFNASELTTGVYIYTFQSNGYSQSRKMILLR